MLAWAGFAVGIVVVAGTAASVFGTLIVPRGGTSRFSSLLGRALDLSMRPAFKLPTFEQRDRVLALRAPLFLVLQLAVWLGLFLVGYALIAWPQVASLRGGFVLAGSSMFTLGFASTAADTDGLIATAFVCATTGLAAVALQISYLPTLYSAFNRRETLVTMLESRGGDPVWGPEILARHVLVDIVDNLPQLYADWERWAADVAESHTNYHVLVYFRSPNPLRNWVVALLAVLDAAAMQMSLNPLTAPSECRLVLRMGFTALRDIARALRIPFDPDPLPDDPIRIDLEEFKRAAAHLRQAGWITERDDDEAYAHFRGWRVNYEQIAWALADRVEAPPALWSGPRRHALALQTAPRRPQDRRPRPDQRTELQEHARRRRVARAMRAGQTLPLTIRRLAHVRTHLDDVADSLREVDAAVDVLAGLRVTPPSGDGARRQDEATEAAAPRTR